METSSSTPTKSPPDLAPVADPPVPARAVVSPQQDLLAEVRGTLLLFLLTVLVTAGVALCANAVVSAVG